MTALSLLILVIAVFAAYQLGWHSAHHTVATECDKLGSFYVGNKVYRCVLASEYPHYKGTP